MYATLSAPMFRTFAAACAAHPFLGLVPWYAYMKLQLVNDFNGNSVCEVVNFNSATGQNPAAILGTQSYSTSPFLLIGLAIIEDLMRIAAYAAVGYIIYGGIQYQISNGAPDKTKQAQQTITNAIIGLMIAILAASIVAFVGNRLS